MKKPDDDLKIDISEIFGGELPELPAEKKTSNETVPQAQEDAGELSRDTQAQYQAWFTAREKELESKTKNLEKRVEELQLQLSQTTKMDEIHSPALPPSPVDFNAPIPPPFFNTLNSSPIKTESKPFDSPISHVPPQSPVNPLNFNGLESDLKFLIFYDEFRVIIAHEITDLVGERKTATMLERTFEIARGKYPSIFKNANWDSAGNLLNDGSLNGQKIIENKSSLRSAHAEVLLDSALTSLLNLRLQAVEKGLGSGLRNKVRAHLLHWIGEKCDSEKKLGNDISMFKRLSAYIP